MYFCWLCRVTLQNLVEVADNSVEAEIKWHKPDPCRVRLWQVPDRLSSSSRRSWLRWPNVSWSSSCRPVWVDSRNPSRWAEVWLPCTSRYLGTGCPRPPLRPVAPPRRRPPKKRDRSFRDSYIRLLSLWKH